MKPARIFSWLVVVFAGCIVFGAWKTYDYGLNCTKCLARKHVVTERFFGITFFKRTTSRDSKHDYERIFGRACSHVFRKGGYGRTSHFFLMGSSIACGVTGEGIMVRPRIAAVSATFDAEQRLHDVALAQETFNLIDNLIPPNFGWPEHRRLTKTAMSDLFLLASRLRDANSVEQWRDILETAKEGFPDTRSTRAEQQSL